MFETTIRICCTVDKCTYPEGFFVGENHTFWCGDTEIEWGDTDSDYSDGEGEDGEDID